MPSASCGVYFCLYARSPARCLHQDVWEHTWNSGMGRNMSNIYHKWYLSHPICLPLFAVYMSVYIPASPPAASAKMFGSIHGTQEWVGICLTFTINDTSVIQYAFRYLRHICLSICPLPRPLPPPKIFRSVYRTSKWGGMCLSYTINDIIVIQ